MTIKAQTEQPRAFRHVLQVGSHTLHADIASSEGGQDSAPSPHDYFDASLAACKALTAMWYAKRHGIGLERVETVVERNDTRESQGSYVLQVKLAFFGTLTAEDERRLHAVVARCPIHKLMTTGTIDIVTAPLEVPAESKDGGS